jgi:hypothetical protein
LTAVYEDLKELGFDHTDMKYYLWIKATSIAYN